MRIETSVKYTSNLKTVISSSFSAATIYHMTHEDLLDWLNDRLYQREDYQRLPRWAKSQLGGFMDAKRDEVYKHYLKWQVRLDGELIDGKDVPKGRWSEVETGSFVWIDTGKVF